MRRADEVMRTHLAQLYEVGVVPAELVGEGAAGCAEPGDPERGDVEGLIEEIRGRLLEALEKGHRVRLRLG